MKLSKTFAAAVVIVISVITATPPSYANGDVRIKFPWTSYCSGYAGERNNFVIELSSGQELMIGLKNNKPIRVLSPSGYILPFEKVSSHLAKWQVNSTGNYKIQFQGGGLTIFDVCAIDSPDQPVFDPALGAQFSLVSLMPVS